MGTFSGTYKTTYSKALGNLWLKQAYDFPPGGASEGSRTPMTAEALMGYDEEQHTWVRFFADSIGQYFAIRMKDDATGWTWKYVSYFQGTKPDATDDATFVKKSEKEYEIKGPTYEENGAQVTEHHVCHKQ